jgi:arsenate reductase
MSRPLRVLVLCTGNSARSQIAEALLNRLGAGRIEAQSAGSRPAARVNPGAIEVLRRHGIEWHGHAPRGLHGLDGERWDVVITVCDNAREACPVFPGHPAQTHWGMPDPAEEIGSEASRKAAFDKAYTTIASRVARMVALPLERMSAAERSDALRAIGVGAHAT